MTVPSDTDETYGEWLRRVGADSPHVTASERALLLWERARDEEPEQVARLDAMIGRVVALRRSRLTVLGAMEPREVAAVVLTFHDRASRRSVPKSARFLVRARFGSRLLGVELETRDAMLLREEWVEVVLDSGLAPGVERVQDQAIALRGEGEESPR